MEMGLHSCVAVRRSRGAAAEQARLQVHCCDAVYSSLEMANAVQVLKEVPTIRYVDRVITREVPVVQVVERVVEVLKEVPIEVVKEVPVYVR